jgi:hypothetical protein
VCCVYACVVMTVLGDDLRKNRRLDFFNKSNNKRKERPVAAAAGAARLSSLRHQRLLGPQQKCARTTTSATKSPRRVQRRREPLSSLMPAWMNVYNNNSNRLQEQEEPGMMQENRMELDILTVRVIKTQVLNILSDFGGSRSCYMLDICMALKRSPAIKTMLLLGLSSSSPFLISSSAAATTTTTLPDEYDDDDDDHGFVLGRGYFKSFLSSLSFSAKKRKQEAASMQQMYRFMATMDALEATPSSSTTPISTWEEALEEFKAVFCFSPRALQDLELQEQDDYFDKDYDTASASATGRHKDDDQNDIDKTITYVKDLLDPMTDFQKRSYDVHYKNTFLELKESTKRWLQVISAKAPPSRTEHDDDDDDAAAVPRFVVELDAADLALEQRLQRQEQKTLQHRTPVAVREAEARMQRQEAALEEQLAEQARQAEARERAAALMRPFTDPEKEQIQTALYSIGPEDEIIATAGTDSVQRGSIQRLRPGQVSSSCCSVFSLFIPLVLF